MRILVATRRVALRDSLKVYLQLVPGIKITGMVSNRAELLSQVKTDSPDLLLLDEDISKKLVEDVIIPIQQIDSAPEVMVLGYRTKTKQAVLDAGAVAFVNKSDHPRTLLTAIEEFRLRGNGE